MEEDDKERIVILEQPDGFTIAIGDRTWHFDQEESKEDLVEVFKWLGYKDVTYEDDY